MCYIQVVVIIHHMYDNILHSLNKRYTALFITYVLSSGYTITQRQHPINQHLNTTNRNYISIYYTC